MSRRDRNEHNLWFHRLTDIGFRIRSTPLALGWMLFAVSIHAAPPVSRPPIVGIAHVGLFVSDPGHANKFYGQVLGFDHFSANNPDGSLFLSYYKVNEHQYIEIFPGLKGDDQDRLSHVAFETTDIRKLRDYLESKGVKVPASVKTGRDRNLNMMVDDPEGRKIEFVEYTPESLHSSKKGKLLPATRVSEHMIHSGFIVRDRSAEDKFYKDILGFSVMWYGGSKEGVTNWVDMRVPDGSDWLEYMLEVKNSSPKTRGVMNHLALGVTSIQPAYQQILKQGGNSPEPPKLGHDGKWQLNLYDPYLTRVELMEFKPSRTPCCSPMHAP
jgi:catechol 2,3-dioxygenase-like lactoylglutathione lyase family enzyme